MGDGTVILNQQADEEGNAEAFSSVNIASGRPVVVLANDKQVEPDSISWDFRGSTLDVNGNSLTFHGVKTLDYGAALANNAQKRATITLNYQNQTGENGNLIKLWTGGSGKGKVGDLYETPPSWYGRKELLCPARAKLPFRFVPGVCRNNPGTGYQNSD